jgi:hypothetical protein
MLSVDHVPQRVRSSIVLVVFALLVAGAWVTGRQENSPVTGTSPTPPPIAATSPERAPCDVLSRERAQSLGLSDPVGRNIPVRKTGAAIQACAYGTTRIAGTSADLSTERGLTNEEVLRNLNLWADLGPAKSQPLGAGRNATVYRPANRHNGESGGCLVVVQRGPLEHVTAMVYDKRSDKRTSVDHCPYAVELVGAAVAD